MAVTTAPRIGTLPSGPRDAITDVHGVAVGHHTLADGPVQTGVTVIRPHAGDPFRDRVPAAAVVLNGFGKSIGLVQVEELGVLETPIALTNTFAVAAVAQAQIRQCIRANPETGRALPTVNPLVFECNDGYLNDIQRLAVGEEHYLAACESAGAEVAQGAVGAGRGMSSFGLKGGIGTASRRVAIAGHGEVTIGVLVQSNFGLLPQLTIAGDPAGARIARKLSGPQALAEQGSIILVVATDAPLDARQLRRLA
ncbi:P1 family peptidase, partial [Ramlibacter sp.]|uniref:P1 family peptidase n=1 Tax=Ramlibacter sp. TaxID=1917967 RepID=UPI0017CB5453